MAWFLKGKIRKAKRKIEVSQKQLIFWVNKYNELLNEHNGLNTFAPITFGQQPPDRLSQIEPPEDYTPEPEVMRQGIDRIAPIKKPMTKEEWGQLMKQKRAEAQAKRMDQNVAMKL